MRHHKKKRVFGREAGQYRALLKTLAHSLVNRGKILTTEAKARELRPFVEKLVTMAKNETLASRRLLISRVGPTAAKKLCVDLAKKYASRAGGYTRITKIGRRIKDAAKMAHIEFV
jgi:large subunit ribosomal protein L17